MRIIIVGAGEVGYNIALILSKENHEVIVIEEDSWARHRCEEHLDVLTIEGNGASQHVLEQAGVREADMLIAVTDSDEVNMIACFVAKQIGSVKTIARIRNPDYLENASVISRDVLGIDYVINPESAAAVEIAKLLHTPGAIAVAHFALGKVQMVEFKVEETLSITDIPLKDLNLRDKCLVAAILRNNKMIIPGGNDVIREGDRVFVIGKSEKMKKVEKLFGQFKRDGIRRVAFLGGGRITCHLAKILSRDGIHVTVIENNKDRCKEIAEDMPNILVVHGDGTDLDLLKEERISEVDAFASLTTDDKINLLVSLLVKHLGVGRVITKVSRGDIGPLVEKIGLDVAISPRLLTANTILQYIRGGNVISIALLEDGMAEIVEVVAGENLQVAGKPLREINFPKGAIIGAIVHGNEVVVPTGHDAIQAGDRVIIFTLPSAVAQIERYFS